MEYVPAEKNHGLPHDPFKALVIPRPIGWITTLGSNGQINLAPYSFFNALGGVPPVVYFSSEYDTSRPDGRKDSVINAEACGEFVCNLANYPLREAMNLTSAAVDGDEMQLAGLTPTASSKVQPPRVLEAPAHLECRWLQTMRPRKDQPRDPFVVLGEVVCVHIQDTMLVDGRLDYDRLQPIARLGYMDYARVGVDFSLDRPTS